MDRVALLITMMIVFVVVAFVLMRLFIA